MRIKLKAGKLYMLADFQTFSVFTKGVINFKSLVYIFHAMTPPFYFYYYFSSLQYCQNLTSFILVSLVFIIMHYTLLPQPPIAYFI